MPEPSPILNFLVDMAARLPLIIVWIVGIVFAILRWRRHPRASLLILIGLVLFILGAFVFSLLHHMLFYHLIMDDASSERIQQTLFPVQITGAVVHMAGWILVLIGAFSAAAAPGAVERPTTAQTSDLLTGVHREALGRIVPVSPAFYISIIAGSFGLVLVLTLISSVFIYLADEPIIGGGVACVSALPVLVGMTAMCVFIHRIWDAIQMGQPRTTPGKAVGFLFIPFFNFYWAFQVYWGWAKDYNRLIAEHGIDAPAMPEGLALALCIFMVVTTPLGFIPFLGPLVSIAGLVLLLTFVAKACGAVEALINAGTSVQPAPPTTTQ